MDEELSGEGNREQGTDSDLKGKRHLPFEGIWNFRDLGGYDTRDGRKTRWGRLFRSGQLSSVTQGDQTALEDLGLELICDFRYEGEQNRAPTVLSEALQTAIQNLPIKTGSFRGFFEANADNRPGQSDIKEAMKKIYRDFVNEHGQTYATMFRHLAGIDGGALIHCTAGKDRTGFGAAMILFALGVDAETIMEDYLLSSKYFSAETALETLLKDTERAKRFPFDLDVFRPVYEVYPEYLSEALDEIHRQYASVDRYLEQVLGVTPEVRKRLQERYLVE